MNSVFNVISFVPFQHDLVIKTLNRKLGSWQNELMMSLTENIIMTERLQWSNHCYDRKITMTKPLLWPKDYNDQTIAMTKGLLWPKDHYDQQITLTKHDVQRIALIKGSEGSEWEQGRKHSYPSSILVARGSDEIDQIEAVGQEL